MTQRTFGQPATPRPDNEIERVLVVVAHPDDCDFGAAGTTAGWVDAGLSVTILLCTHGEQGGSDDSNRDQMPAVREREQIAASAVLGVKDVRFLAGHRDGWLEPSWELQRQIVEVIRDVRPQGRRPAGSCVADGTHGRSAGRLPAGLGQRGRRPLRARRGPSGRVLPHHGSGLSR